MHCRRPLCDVGPIYNDDLHTVEIIQRMRMLSCDARDEK
jgi:hypothetical protein